MKSKKTKHYHRAKKQNYRRYRHIILIGIIGFTFAVVVLFISSSITKAVKYSQSPTSLPTVAASLIPTPSSDATVIQFINPKDFDNVSHSTWISINTTAQDWDGITNMEIYTDGDYLCQGNTNSLACSWRTGKSGTKHVLEVRSVDGMGNIASTSIQVIAK